MNDRSVRHDRFVNLGAVVLAIGFYAALVVWWLGPDQPVMTPTPAAVVEWKINPTIRVRTVVVPASQRPELEGDLATPGLTAEHARTNAAAKEEQ